jgi:hypothetical protein
LNADKICKTIDPGCIRYQRGVCTDCLPAYKLKGNVCDMEGCTVKSGSSCTTCDSKYDLVNGGCKLKNCM